LFNEKVAPGLYLLGGLHHARTKKGYKGLEIRELLHELVWEQLLFIEGRRRIW